MGIRVPLLLMLATLLVVGGARPAAALDPAGQKEFRALLELSRDDLAQRAQTVLDRKYPSESWEIYGFPRAVYSDRPTTIAYRVAVKEPDALGVAVCACFCSEMGHKNLAHCFLNKGKLSSGFDDHASGCNICVRQALLVFLWTDLGANPAEIRQAMGEKFGTR